MPYKDLNKRKEYSKKYHKKHYIENKDLYKKDPVEKSEYDKLYYLKNKEKRNIQKRIWQSNKLKTDLLFKLKYNLRARFTTALKGNYKIGSAVRDLGCSIEEFKQYIESKFQEGMTWENWGRYGWHIDHIIPISSAKTPEETIKLCHYTNLQPLWAKDNLSKGDKYLDTGDDKKES